MTFPRVLPQNRKLHKALRSLAIRERICLLCGLKWKINERHKPHCLAAPDQMPAHKAKDAARHRTLRVSGKRYWKLIEECLTPHENAVKELT